MEASKTNLQKNKKTLFYLSPEVKKVCIKSSRLLCKAISFVTRYVALKDDKIEFSLLNFQLAKTCCRAESELVMSSGL